MLRRTGEGFASVFPKDNDFVTSANIRLIYNGNEIGYVDLSMANEWGNSNLYNADWQNLGFGRLWLPNTGDVTIQISISAVNNRFFIGSSNPVIYNGYLKFP